MTGCGVREATGDWAGGTTIEQCAAVAEQNGVHVEIRTGSSVASPSYLALSLQAGRGASLAGNTKPDGRGNVNHNVWVNEASGGSAGAPGNALVYDPWSAGPAWWSWSRVMAFAHALHPWGESDPRTLANMGVSGVYCGLFPDTEPHFHSHYGGVRTSPFPDDVFGKKGASSAARTVRSGPGTKYKAIRVLAEGARFGAYQLVPGGAIGPADDWMGDHNGVYWISTNGVTGRGVKP